MLAIEAARAGEATGEATAVLRTLPGSARRRLPFRVRQRGLVLVALGVLAAALVAGGLLLAANNTHRGTGVAAGAAGTGTLIPVQLSEHSANAYNPFGDTPEHPETVGFAVDGDPSTYWTTQHYLGGNLGKPGVGVYLDAAPGVAGRALEIQTPTPGFDASVYVSNQAPKQPSGGSQDLGALGWQGPVASATAVRNGQRLMLDTANQRSRYYLLWITKLPPGQEAASISELTLFR